MSLSARFSRRRLLAVASDRVLKPVSRVETLESRRLLAATHELHDHDHEAGHALHSDLPAEPVVVLPDSAVIRGGGDGAPGFQITIAFGAGLAYAAQVVVLP